MAFNWPIDLQELNLVTILFRMGLAILIGGIIGTERDIKHRSAGLRTHMLVCLGAAVVMMTNEYVFELHPDAGIDITRMGAQVVSGIGFLGAGTILVTSENRVQGLTTAAGLWAAATIGLAIGIGFYEITIAGGLAIVFIFILMRPLKHYIQKRTDPTDLTLMVHTQQGFNEFLSYTSTRNLKIAKLDVEKDFQGSVENENELIFLVTLVLEENIKKEDVTQDLKALEGIKNVVEFTR